MRLIKGGALVLLVLCISTVSFFLPELVFYGMDKRNAAVEKDESTPVILDIKKEMHLYEKARLAISGERISIEKPLTEKEDVEKTAVDFLKEIVKRMGAEEPKAVKKDAQSYFCILPESGENAVLWEVYLTLLEKDEITFEFNFMLEEKTNQLLRAEISIWEYLLEPEKYRMEMHPLVQGCQEFFRQKLLQDFSQVSEWRDVVSEYYGDAAEKYVYEADAIVDIDFGQWDTKIYEITVKDGEQDCTFLLSCTPGHILYQCRP